MTSKEALRLRDILPEVISDLGTVAALMCLQAELLEAAFCRKVTRTANHLYEVS
jgi:hypothetical protein